MELASIDSIIKSMNTCSIRNFAQTVLNMDTLMNQKWVQNVQRSRDVMNAVSNTTIVMPAMVFVVTTAMRKMLITVEIESVRFGKKKERDAIT